MKKTVKGAAIPVIVIVVAAVAVAAVGGFVGGVIYANHKKGGLGDSSSLGKETEPPAVAETVEVQETSETEPPTEPPTEPVTSSMNAVDITVSGNDYIYNGTALTLDEVAGILRVNPELPVSVSDENASLKAFNDLTEKLKELGIQYQIKN